MKPILYTADETNFNHRGLGALNETLVYEVTEVLNGEFEIFLEYPVTGHLYEEIQDNRQIKAKPNRKDEPHVFRIYEHELDIETQTVLIYARSNVYDLAGNMLPGLTVRDQTPMQSWSQIESSSLEPIDITFQSDIQTKSSTTWEYQNPLSCIVGSEGSMIQIWGGELKYGNKWIWLYRRRGNDNVATIRYGKNLAGLKATYSTKGLVTAILPYTTIRDEVTEEDVTIIGDVVKSQHIDNYPYPYYQPIEYTETDDSVTDLASLNNAASRYFTEHTGIDLPKINMEVQLIDLSHTKEFAKFKDLENVEIGDTITVYAKKFDVNITAKVNKVVYNGLTNENEVLEVGATRASVYEDYRDLINDTIDKTLKPIQDDINTVRTAANGKNKIFRGPDEPTEGMVDGDLWYKTIGNGEVELYIYNGWTWGDPVVTSGINSQVKAELDKADEVIKEVKKGAEQSQLDADAILEGLGVTDLADTHNEIVGEINANVKDRIDEANRLITQIKTDPNTGIGGYKEMRETVSGYETEIAKIKESPGETIVGYNTLKQTAEGNASSINKVIQTPESTITGYNDLKETAEGNARTIAKLQTEPGEVILNYQKITETSELYERVLGTTEEGVEGSVARIVASSEIIQQEVRRISNNIISGKTGDNLLVSPNNSTAGLETGYFKRHPLKENLINGETYYIQLESPIFGEGLQTHQMGEAVYFTRVEGTNLYEATITYGSTNQPSNELRIVNQSGITLNYAPREVYAIDENGLNSLLEDTNKSVRTIQTQLSNSWSVKNLNSADDVIGQINLTDGNALIEGRNIVLDGETIVKGTFTVTDDMIASGINANKITTGELNAANVNIIGLNVDHVSGFTSDFVATQWNSATGGSTRATGEGIVSTADSGAQTLIQNGVTLTRLPNGSTIGYFGYNAGTTSPFYTITTTLGANFSIRTLTSEGFRSPLEIYPGSNETYLRSAETRITGSTIISGSTTMNSASDFRMSGGNVVNPYGVYLNNGGSFYTTSDNITRIETTSTGVMQFRVGTTQKMRIDNTRNYMNQPLNMQGNSIVESPSVSDARMKDVKGKRLENDLDKIMNIQYVNFSWKENGKSDFGFIAQQIQTIAPEIMMDTADGFLGYNSDSYAHLIGHALQQHVNHTESKINQLKREKATLLEKIVELEGRILDEL